MISAGYTAPQTQVTIDGAKLNDTQLTKLVDNTSPPPFYQDADTLNAFTNLGNQILTGLLNFRLMSMQENIEGRRWEAAETIEGYRKEVALKTLDYLPERDRVAADLTKDVTRIHEAANTDRYERRLRSQERVASMRNLDRAFGMRSDYNYGNPFAA